jgi:hypothetical protein
MSGKHGPSRLSIICFRETTSTVTRSRSFSLSPCGTAHQAIGTSQHLLRDAAQAISGLVCSTHDDLVSHDVPSSSVPLLSSESAEWFPKRGSPTSPSSTAQPPFQGRLSPLPVRERHSSPSSPYAHAALQEHLHPPATSTSLCFDVHRSRQATHDRSFPGPQFFRTHPRAIFPNPCNAAT